MVMATNYQKSSPYYETPVTEGYLDVMQNRTITAENDDQVVELNQTYQYRPDLLANDLYGDSGLWWVFAQRNPNAIKDPIWDFRTGLKIFLPKLSTLKKDLGL
jgi:hypothetical protein|tara:strand:+ start:226 stop:534 length:309 start_codon:yes stop_codon:yes gene_type:complete